MLKRLYIILCLTLVSTVLLTTSVSANAHHGPGYVEITPFWQNIQSINPRLSINNGVATVAGSVTGHMGVESITVNATLVRVNANGTTTHIASWNNLSTTSRMWSWETTRNVTRGYDYRLILTVTAIRDGVSETVTRNSLTVTAH